MQMSQVLYFLLFLRRLPEYMCRQLKAGRYDTPEEKARAAADLRADAATINAATHAGASSATDLLLPTSLVAIATGLPPLVRLDASAATGSAHTTGPLAG